MSPEPGQDRPPWWWPGPLHRTGAAIAIVSNAVVLWQAIVGAWPLGALLWTYWSQSVALGVLHMARLAMLRRYDTEGMKRGDGVPILPSPRLPVIMAILFGIHFGLFHLVYAGFLGILAVRFGSGGTTVTALAAVLIGQVLQWIGYVRRDRSGVPSMTAMLITPYARVLPMHVMLISGFWFVGGIPGLLLFGALKTAVEIASLGLEDRVTERVREKLAEP